MSAESCGRKALNEEQEDMGGKEWERGYFFDPRNSLIISMHF